MGDTLVVSLSKTAVKRSKVRFESELYTLFDFCLLADAVAQVIKLGSANLALADGNNRDDSGRMHGEKLLAAYAVRDTANSDGLVDAAMLLAMMVLRKPVYARGCLSFTRTRTRTVSQTLSREAQASYSVR